MSMPVKIKFFLNNKEVNELQGNMGWCGSKDYYELLSDMCQSIITQYQDSPNDFEWDEMEIPKINSGRIKRSECKRRN